MKTRLEIAANEKVDHEGDLTITKNVGAGAVLTITDGSLIVKGDVLQGATIKLKSTQSNNGVYFSGGGWTVTGAHSVIMVNGVTYIDGVLQDPENLNKKNKEYTISILGSVADNVTLESGSDITIGKNIGSGCDISSKNGGLTANDVGANTEISTYGQITVNDIKTGCQLNSRMHGLTANNIANKVTAKTYEDIKANNVGDNTKLTSSMHGISITTTTGNNVVLQSYENIYLAKVGNDCEIKSRMHGVRISGVTGSNVDINAYEDIRTQHLGAHAHVKSSMHAVSVGNVGPASVIQAYDNININGYCASNAKVKSSMGQVYKNGGTKDPSYFTITAPILEEKPKALQILEEKPKALQIPDAFKCPESGEIMTNPVVFRTSGKTYDESSIRQKLTNMGFEENEITEQLVPNLVLKMMISKFMTDNKEHLQSAKMGR